MYRNLFFWAVAFVLPNLFWQIFSVLLSVNRDFFNVDYFLILLVFFNKWILVFIIVFVSFFDFLNVFSQIFAFIHLSDLFYLIRFSFFMSPINFIFPLSFIVFLILYIKFFLKYLDCSNKLSPIILLNISLLLMVLQNSLVATDSGDNRPWRIQDKNYISSLLLKTYQLRSEAFFGGLNQSGDAFNNVKTKSASQAIVDEGVKYSKYLLIVNESWGVTPPNIQKDILEEIFNNKNISSYEVNSLNVNGFTINGEIRELCQKGLNHFNLRSQEKGFEDCLPSIYKNLDYYTVSMHGATGYMYDRKYWYPKLGFDDSIFRDTLPNLKSRCFSFPGACDKDLLPYIVENFTNHNKIFFYWLTLNTHINYDVRDLSKDLFDCKKYNIETNSASCRNLKLQKQFFYNLNWLINQPIMKGTYIVVVGDHAPPLYGNDKGVFAKDKVSTLRVIVK